MGGKFVLIEKVEEHTRRLLQNRALRKIFGPKGEKLKG
jgi:hypothetical protein